MIKKVILFIVLFFCNFVLSQKQITEKLYNTEYYNDCNEVSINIGKAVFIVVYINNGHPNDSLIAVREFKELKKNYDLLCAYMDSYYFSFEKDEFKQQFPSFTNYKNWNK